MIPVEEARLKIEDIRQAIAYEKKFQYIDVQGRKKPFSRFVSETLNKLAQWQLPGESEDRQLGQLIQRFNNYAYADVGTRMNTLDALERYLETLTVPGGQPRRKTVRQDKPVEINGEPAAPRGRGVHDTDVQYLKGVGPRLARLLNSVGVHTVEDLLYYFPRRYLDYHNRVKIKDLEEGQDVTILGTITGSSAYNAKSGKVSVLNLTVADETGRISATWFYAKANRALLESYKSRWSKGAEVMLSGRVKVDRFKNRFSIDRPQIEVLSYADAAEDASSLNVGRIVPVYPLTEGLNLRFLRRAIHQAMEDHLDTIADPLPDELKRKYGLIGLRDALRNIHFPDTLEHYEEARKRLVFDELFYVQVRLALIRANYKRSVKGLSLDKHDGGLCDRFAASLPFELTNAQQKVFQEILQDLKSPEPMYRLLQGDVGSGKTVVAVMTLLMAVENGYQGALMAPTEILAEQHYRKLIEWLTPLGLRAGLFVGKSTVRQRRELKQGLLNGQIHIAVGTHALIQHDVEFGNLGVVVVDEQHRFGVRQRTLLKDKGDHPEMLTMTATPIPRTLAMTVHGDLDVSLLDELPPGRTPILTSLLYGKQAKKAHDLIRMEVAKGRQAYVVLPLIEESETLSAKAATTEAERLQGEVFPEFRVGLLHGKMRPEEKDAVMSAFAHGQIDVLVSTTVVEVGVDVPNATVMVIENADRFGLAQLHQLRGRVGRGCHQSHCILLTDTRGEDTRQRLQILTDSENGFDIAEKDMALRGPGEFLGTRQSGLPDFVLADLIHDKAILEMAREAAFAVVDNPEVFENYPELRDIVFQKTEDTFNVLGSG